MKDIFFFSFQNGPSNKVQSQQKVMENLYIPMQYHLKENKKEKSFTFSLIPKNRVLQGRSIVLGINTRK